MRIRRMIAIAVGAALATAPAGASAGHAGGGNDVPSRLALAIGRAALPAGDGWAADGTGTTGGGAADAAHVSIVDSRAELIAALGGDNATNRTNAIPKIVFIEGMIDGFERADGSLMSCVDLADPGYTLEAYLATYDPAVWGRVNPSGPLEDARVRSVQNQTRQTQINVGPNTTVVGLRGATLTGLTLMFDTASNGIVRNLRFEDAQDCFPAWAPTDGAAGNWNSQFDNMSVRRSTNVWVDHNTFTDGDNPDSGLPVHFGRPYQVHDGSLDITHTSSLVTVSYNQFSNHDKVMLIGSTNNPSGGDRGRLNVTVHHNVFDSGIQRLPRVRFGKVDVYNNYLRIPNADTFDYAWGVGVESAMVVENNYVSLGSAVTPDRVVRDWGGTVMTELGTWARVEGDLPRPASLLGAYNANHDPDIGADAGWTPTLRRGPVLPAPAVPLVTLLLAGAGRLPL